MKMKILFPLFAFVICVSLFAAQEGPEHAMAASNADMKTYTPDKMEWQDVKAMQPGAKMALLEGDLKSGPFTMQLKLPAGFKIAPHWHPGIEHVTVLSGEFKIGPGEKFDETKQQSMPAGSFFYMPPHMIHFGSVGPETIIQVHGTAPWEINYVNKADDPRAAKM